MGDGAGRDAFGGKMDFGYIRHKIMKQVCRVFKHKWQRIKIGHLLDMRSGRFFLARIDRCSRCAGTWIEPADGPLPPDRA